MGSDKPILFSGDMVRAILDGRKTMTRRIVKKQPPEDFFSNGVIDDSTCGKEKKDDFVFGNNEDLQKSTEFLHYRCPYGLPGDVLVVKETHAVIQTGDPGDNGITGAYVPFDPIIVYRADGWEKPNDAAKLMSIDTGHKWFSEDNKWKTSLFMPKKFARIRLPITRIRMERLHDITAADAVAEGIERVRSPNGLRAIFWRDYLGDCSGYIDPIKSFMSLWASINGRDSVKANPYVWVVEFEAHNG